MIRALFSAASGLQAQQMHVDVISNNIANSNTPGFKKDRINFQDLLYQTYREAGSTTLSGAQQPTGLRVGLGVKPVATEKLFSQGAFQGTGNPLDVVVEGDGFFQVLMQDGSTAYTRDGTFKIDGNGNIVTSDGSQMNPNIVIPENAVSIDITPDGNISVMLPGQTTQTQIGQIQLARFQNPGGLKAAGKNLFLETDASGAPQTGNPGEDGYGTVIQGYVEMSNVSIVEELVNLILAQRGFETNSKAVQTADEILQIANQLRR
ncbi:flagellar basal-body rod protein FlgG [bacterium]|nr:flagellar basal-body rod protein FlgG [bacterium]MBU1024868.1 flagellar basal-body rod protein FlgG [bacterium]